MLRAYVDTNVIVARYKPGDPLHESADRLFGLPEATFYVSPLTLVELYSAFSRVEIESTLPELNLHALVAFCLKDCKLELISKSHLLRAKVAEREFKAPLEYCLAVKLAEQLRLRALDLLHVTYALLLKKAKLADVLITGDEEILEKGDLISAATGVRVRHPKELNSELSV